jgi:streptogramin lyase
VHSATRGSMVVLVTLAGLAVPACTRSTTTCPPQPTTGPGVSRLDLGGRVSNLAVGNGAVWGVKRQAQGHSHYEIVEIDPSTGRIVGRPVPLSGLATGLDVGEGAVWAVTIRGVLLRIDPASHQTLSRVQLPRGVSGLAAGLGGVWITNADDGTVSRVDPLTGRVLQTTHVPYEPQRIEVGDQGVWVQTRNQKAPLYRIYRIDPATGRVTNELDGQLEAVGAHALWVTGLPPNGGFRRVDPTTVQPEGPTLDFDIRPESVGIAGAQVWVGKYFYSCHSETEGPVGGSFAWFRVDPATLRALSGPVFVGSGPGPYAHPVFSGVSLWIEPQSGRRVLRIELKIAGAVAPTASPGLPSPATRSE